MTPLLWAGLAALANLVGAAILVGRSSRSIRLLEGSVAFGAGFMLSVVLVEVISAPLTPLLTA